MYKSKKETNRPNLAASTSNVRTPLLRPTKEKRRKKISLKKHISRGMRRLSELTKRNLNHSSRWGKACLLIPSLLLGFKQKPHDQTCEAMNRQLKQYNRLSRTLYNAIKPGANYIAPIDTLHPFNPRKIFAALQQMKSNLDKKYKSISNKAYKSAFGKNYAVLNKNFQRLDKLMERHRSPSHPLRINRVDITQDIEYKIFSYLSTNIAQAKERLNLSLVNRNFYRHIENISAYQSQATLSKMHKSLSTVSSNLDLSVPTILYNQAHGNAYNLMARNQTIQQFIPKLLRSHFESKGHGIRFITLTSDKQFQKKYPGNKNRTSLLNLVNGSALYNKHGMFHFVRVHRRGRQQDDVHCMYFTLANPQPIVYAKKLFSINLTTTALSSINNSDTIKSLLVEQIQKNPLNLWENLQKAIRGNRQAWQTALQKKVSPNNFEGKILNEKNRLETVTKDALRQIKIVTFLFKYMMASIAASNIIVLVPFFLLIIIGMLPFAPWALLPPIAGISLAVGTPVTLMTSFLAAKAFWRARDALVQRSSLKQWSKKHSRNIKRLEQLTKNSFTSKDELFSDWLKVLAATKVQYAAKQFLSLNPDTLFLKNSHGEQLITRILLDTAIHHDIKIDLFCEFLHSKIAQTNNMSDISQALPDTTKIIQMVLDGKNVSSKIKQKILSLFLQRWEPNAYIDENNKIDINQNKKDLCAKETEKKVLFVKTLCHKLEKGKGPQTSPSGHYNQGNEATLWQTHKYSKTDKPFDAKLLQA